MFAAGGGLAGLALDPLPDLERPGGVGVDDEVLVGRLGDLAVDLAAHRVIGNAVVGIRGGDVGDHAALLGDRGQGVGPVVHRDFKDRAVAVPAKLLDKELGEVEVLQALSDASRI